MRLTQLAALLPLLTFGQSAQPAVAYSSGGRLYLATDTGQVVKTIRSKIPIGQFAISSDASIAVFLRPRRAQVNGGQLYRLDVHSGKVRRITHGHLYEKHEVYGVPDFSSGGARIAFSIYSQAVGDPIKVVGPVAIIDLGTRTAQVLQTTRNWGGLGPIYVFSSLWSPDDERILMNVVGTFAIADANGRRKQEFSELTDVAITEERGVQADGWLGPNCVVFEYYEDYAKLQLRHPQILNLRTREKRAAVEVMGVSEEKIGVPFSFHNDGTAAIIKGPKTSWRTPAIDGFAMIGRSSSIPASCL